MSRPAPFAHQRFMPVFCGPMDDFMASFSRSIPNISQSMPLTLEEAYLDRQDKDRLIQQHAENGGAFLMGGHASNGLFGGKKAKDLAHTLLEKGLPKGSAKPIRIYLMGCDFTQRTAKGDIHYGALLAAELHKLGINADVATVDPSAYTYGYKVEVEMGDSDSAPLEVAQTSSDWYMTLMSMRDDKFTILGVPNIPEAVDEFRQKQQKVIHARETLATRMAENKQERRKLYQLRAKTLPLNKELDKINKSLETMLKDSDQYRSALARQEQVTAEILDLETQHAEQRKVLEQHTALVDTAKAELSAARCAVTACTALLAQSADATEVATLHSRVSPHPTLSKEAMTDLSLYGMPIDRSRQEQVKVVEYDKVFRRQAQRQDQGVDAKYETGTLLGQVLEEFFSSEPKNQESAESEKDSSVRFQI